MWYARICSLHNDSRADIQITGLKRDLPSLRRQCERFKTERASLQTEIASLRSERDTLRLEVSSSHDQTTYLNELSVSGELDGQGKLNRKIWALEQKNEALHREIEARGVKYEQELEKERNVGSGLRDRIGSLDEKRRKVQKGLEEAEGREKRLKGELEALTHISRADIARLQAELEIARGGPKATLLAVNRASQERPEVAIVR
jgi:chromosome segregation ATPase